MESYTYDYVTRGGIAIEIELPIGANGRIISEQYLTDSERRRIRAIRLRAEVGSARSSEKSYMLH